MHKCTLAYDLMLVKYIISAHGPIYFPSQFQKQKGENVVLLYENEKIASKTP